MTSAIAGAARRSLAARVPFANRGAVANGDRRPGVRPAYIPEGEAAPSPRNGSLTGPRRSGRRRIRSGAYRHGPPGVLTRRQFGAPPGRSYRRRLDQLAAGPHDRVDELYESHPRSPRSEQLGERHASGRSVRRNNRRSRTGRSDCGWACTSKTADWNRIRAGRPDGVLQRGRLDDRARYCPVTTPHVAARRASSACGPAGGRDRGNHVSPAVPPARATSSSRRAVPVEPVAQPMRLATARRSRAANVTRCGSVTTGTLSAPATSASIRWRAAASPLRQVDGLQRPRHGVLPGLPLEEGSPRYGSPSMADRDVPSRVNVVHEQEHLAETRDVPGCPDQQFRVALSQVVTPRRGDGSSSPCIRCHRVRGLNQSADCLRAVERRADQPPPEAAASPPPPDGAASGLGLERVDQGPGTPAAPRRRSTTSREHVDRQQAGRIEDCAASQPSVRSPADRRFPRRRRSEARANSWRDNTMAAPTSATQRSASSVVENAPASNQVAIRAAWSGATGTVRRTPAPRQRPAVHPRGGRRRPPPRRGRRRRRCPRPATRSIFTPASTRCARITPA